MLYTLMLFVHSDSMGLEGFDGGLPKLIVIMVQEISPISILDPSQAQGVREWVLVQQLQHRQRS
jgi:hypothetical protein